MNGKQESTKFIHAYKLGELYSVAKTKVVVVRTVLVVN